jgi:tetratricopeptide (TPR) repeat protein
MSRVPQSLARRVWQAAIIIKSLKFALMSTSVKGKWLRLRADWLLRCGQYPAAVRAYESLADVERPTAYVFAMLGYCHTSLGEYKSAIEAYDRALTLKPDYAGVHAELGSVLSQCNQFQAARESLERAFRIGLKPTPKVPYWRQVLGFVCTRLGDWESAAQNLKLSADAQPSADVLCNLASALWHINKTEDSVAAYLKALQIDPRHVVALYGLGYAYFELERYADAIEPLKKAAEVDSKYAAAVLYLGLAYANVGNYDEALKYLNQAAILRPEDENTKGAIQAVKARLADEQTTSN